VKNIAPDFSSCAVAEDGIVEAIYHKNKKFIFGVQWHPERDREIAVNNKKIIDKFISVCAEAKK
ncbi:MAG: gamma-glutamyl-gamma-aminobutyrate hydrolase family protein, partial [Oscillospiraceae bacterium]|nr:gamma-glutamyl-gamma-aminobutyrate hydrolase family protein [Oscillospiraceae bacterium]